VLARLTAAVKEQKLELKLLGGDVNALHPSWQTEFTELSMTKGDVRIYRGEQLAAAMDAVELRYRGGANTFPNDGSGKKRYSIDIIASRAPLTSLKRIELGQYSDHDLVVATWQETARASIRIGTHRRAVWYMNGINLADDATKGKLGKALDDVIGVDGVGTMPTGVREKMLRDALQRALEGLGARRRYVLQRAPKDDFEETMRSAIDVKKNGDWAELNRFIRSKGNARHQRRYGTRRTGERCYRVRKPRTRSCDITLRRTPRKHGHRMPRSGRDHRPRTACIHERCCNTVR